MLNEEKQFSASVGGQGTSATTFLRGELNNYSLHIYSFYIYIYIFNTIKLVIWKSKCFKLIKMT